MIAADKQKVTMSKEPTTKISTILILFRSVHNNDTFQQNRSRSQIIFCFNVVGLLRY